MAITKSSSSTCCSDENSHVKKALPQLMTRTYFHVWWLPSFRPKIFTKLVIESYGAKLHLNQRSATTSTSIGTLGWLSFQVRQGPRRAPGIGPAKELPGTQL